MATMTNILVSLASPDTWRHLPCVSLSDDTFRCEPGMMYDGVILVGLIVRNNHCVRCLFRNTSCMEIGIQFSSAPLTLDTYALDVSRKVIV